VPEPHLGYSTAFGSKFAVIPGGCPTNTLSRTFHGSEIGSIQGRAAWAAPLEEGVIPADLNDIGSVKIITDNIVVLQEWSIANDGFSTGWTDFAYTFDECKTYTLVVSSTNTGDCLYDSYILLDFQFGTGSTLDCHSGTNGDPHCK
jgi:hypothetical protein